MNGSLGRPVTINLMKLKSDHCLAVFVVAKDTEPLQILEKIMRHMISNTIRFYFHITNKNQPYM